MNKIKNKRSLLTIIGIITLSLLILGAASECSDAAIASDNISEAADQFQIVRRIVFYNGITDEYMLVIEGRCSIQIGPQTLRVTCKIGDSAYKKHYLGLSDNVTYFVEQIKIVDVSVYHHKVTFKPQAIIPSIELRGNVRQLIEAAPDVKID